MKQHTIPQNIMSVEFKIIGDLSIRQFIYMSIAGAASFLFYLLPMPGIVKFPLIFFCVTLGILITFAKVRERPFDAFITSFIVTIFLPTQRVWKKGGEIPVYLKEPVAVLTTTKAKPNKKTIERDDNYNKVLSYLHSRNLPTDDIKKSNTKLDIEELKLLASIDKAMDSNYTNNSSSNIPVSNMNTDNKNAVPKSSPFYTDLQASNSYQTSDTLPISSMPPINNQSSTFQFNPLAHLDLAAAATPVMPPTNQQRTSSQSEDNKVEKPIQNESVNNMYKPDSNEFDEQLLPETILQEQNEKESEQVITIEPETVVKFDDLKEMTNMDHKNMEEAMIFDPSSYNQAPVIAASEDFMRMESSEQANKSTNGLNLLSNEEPEIAPAVSQITPPITPLDESVLSIHIDTVSTAPVQTIPSIPDENSKTVQSDTAANSELLALQEQIRVLQEQLTRSKSHEKENELAPQPQVQQMHIASEEETLSNNQKLLGHMPDFILFPNIISGVVIDANEKIVEDVVVILKDKSKRIMRAMKTNLLGQFYSRNPLLNGAYDIEANKEGFIFEKITIELHGEVVNPVIIHPKKFNTQIESGTTFNLLNS